MNHQKKILKNVDHFDVCENYPDKKRIKRKQFGCSLVPVRQYMACKNHDRACISCLNAKTLLRETRLH